MHGYAPVADIEEDAHQDDNMNADSPLIWKLTIVIAISGLLFGYDTAVIGIVIIVIGNDLGRELSSTELEAIVSSTTVGALCGSIASGWISDKLGRKWTAISSSLVFILGGLIQAFASSFTQMIIGRWVVGLAVGVASMIVPLYISEMAPAQDRGRLVTTNVLMITGGQVLAYLVDNAFYSVQGGWRWMVGSSVVPPLLQLLGLFSLPESPRWLVSKGRIEQAQQVYGRIYPHSSTETIKTITSRIQASQSAPASYLSFTAPSFLIACGLQCAQQLSGFNTAMYYSPMILRSANLTNPTLFAVLIALANFAFTFVALRIIDNIGRRTILLQSVVAMTISLACLGLVFIFIDPARTSIFTSVLALCFLVAYVSSYALGLGNVPWLYQSELGLDSRAVGFATATNWTCNLIVGATFLDGQKAIGISSVFWIYAVICAVIWLFVVKYVPETTRLPVEDIVALFADGRNLVARGEELQQRHKLHVNTEG